MDWSSESKKGSIHQEEEEEEEEEGPCTEEPAAVALRVGCRIKGDAKERWESVGRGFRALYKRRLLAYRRVIVPSSSYRRWYAV